MFLIVKRKDVSNYFLLEILITFFSWTILIGVDSEEELENATTSEHILKILGARSALYERQFDVRVWPR